MTSKPLRNSKVLITAGPTREYWDPVRFLTNASSGQMGIALAQEARRLGAKVTLVLGPSSQGPGLSQKRSRALGSGRWGLKTIPVISAWEMYEAVRRHLPGTDVFVGAAAVVDYRPARILKKKIKRRRPSVSLRLVGNPDIIAMIGHLPKNRPVTVIGFALETGHLLENAAEKLMRKRLDWIVANRPSALGQESGEVTLLSRWGDKVTLKRATKVTLAKKIWQTILKN